MTFNVKFFVLILASCAIAQTSALNTNEDEAREFIMDLDESYTYECNMEMEASWAYITDVENATAEELANEADVEYFQFQSEAAKNVSDFDYNTFEDVELYRMFRFQADAGPGGLDEANLTRYQELQSGMENIYSTATICNQDQSDCSLTLEPDLEYIMATSTDFDELQYVWEEWRNVSGRLMRDDYVEFVALSNQAAELDGYADTGEYWLNGYTVTTKEVDGYGSGLEEIDQQVFQMKVQEVWEDVFEKLYKPLHAYVRMKMQTLYPEHVDSKYPMPANILGNMWAQDWTNIAQYVMPFEDQPDFDVTQSMIDNGWDIDQMFYSAEDFFTSIGLYEMTETFWDKSVINQTAWGKAIICHASAEDFCLGHNSTDFRIKMCTEVNMNDLVTVHHEMGHIEYFMAYRDQPHVFRESANPGFHEAIGDLIALSVSTPSHMEDVLNLTSTLKDNKNGKDDYTPEEQRDINFLMRMALEKIAFLPFGYLIDKYRWGIFDGSIAEEHLNSEWWNLREEYQGVVPPGPARRENYFDAGAKYHIPANVPYIRYFVSFIVQFQFHKNLCNATMFEGPLYMCDLYNMTEAGDILKDSMAHGFSEPWPMILNELGASMEMSADAIKEYFQPLMDYLETALEGENIGWIQRPKPAVDDVALAHLKLMEKNLTISAVESVEAAWTYNTNVTDYNAEQMNQASVTFSQIYKEWWEDLISEYYYEGVSNPMIRRQFDMQQSIGTAILEKDKVEELNTHLTNMMEQYGNKVCTFDDMKCKDSDGYDIDRLEIEMAVNPSYSELLYYWEEWRDVSGKNMIEDFKAYVDLQNEAAIANNFKDAVQMWVDPYTTYGAEGPYDYSAQEFQDDIENIWQKVSPYYHKLQAYVRDKLRRREEYGKYFSEDNLIPAHILGNMWAQSWENIYDYVAPFGEIDLIDISKTLEDESNAEEMFYIAEDFFTSIGLYNMTEDFWNNSMITQPEDGRQVVCHASAWDFYSTEEDNTVDGRYRIKMCTNTNQEDFIVVHHEMGHIQYFMAYSDDTPLIFRNGANPGFHEAIGDTIALSVSTPSHLMKIESYLLNGTMPDRQTNKHDDSNGYLLISEKDEEFGKHRREERKNGKDDDYTDEEKININFLMKTALAKVAFLPYAYILDQWRWKVFSGDIVPDVYNKAWWEMRIDYQGIRPPIDRSGKLDFDIGCKYHVPAGVPYIRYFVAHILQFEFHSKLCSLANDTQELFNCDIYGSTDAGMALGEMLSKGASEHWQTQLASFLEVAAPAQMDPNTIIDYFGPLWDFLDAYIEENNLDTTWASSADVIDDYINETETISAIVPIIVGVVLAVLVCIVVVAFFVGQSRRKKKEKLDEAEKAIGTVNEAMELHEKEDKEDKEESIGSRGE